MRDTFEPYMELYEKGFAVGHSNIRDDTIEFDYHEEKWSFPTVSVYPIAKFNGYFYVAPVEKLRELKRRE